MKLLSKSTHWLYQKVFRTVDIPEQLAAVTDIDVEGELDPKLAGLDQAAVDEIWGACQKLYRTGVYPMLSVCLRRQGKMVLNRSLGYVSDNKNKIATVDTPVCLFSASKAMSAVLIHLLAEQCKVNLLDPVSYYIPQFAARGKGRISILQLLTHRGGVPKVPEGTEVDLLFDHQGAMEMICASEPTDHLGRIQAYHAITGGFIIDELIRVTTGLNAQQYMHKYISKPMGMRYFRYGVTKKDLADVAVNTSTGFDSKFVDNMLAGLLGADLETVVKLTNDPRFYQAIVPAANLYATAEETSRFFQMMLNHGEWQGRQILQPLTVHRATHILGRAEMDKSLMVPMRYSAGFMLGGNPIGIYGLNSQYAYGHLGFSNILCWADPQRDISVAILNSGKPVVGPHIKSFLSLMATITNHCDPIVDMESDLPIYQPAVVPAAAVG
jgi:CubicO group peptidase (beta-lactamase class C family)